MLSNSYCIIKNPIYIKIYFNSMTHLWIKQQRANCICNKQTNKQTVV